MIGNVVLTSGIALESMWKLKSQLCDLFDSLLFGATEGQAKLVPLEDVLIAETNTIANTQRLLNTLIYRATHSGSNAPAVIPTLPDPTLFVVAQVL